jgi:protein SCO1/2
MAKKNSIWVFVAAVVILPVSVFAVVKWYERSFTKLPVLGGEKHTISNFSLTNQHGATTTLNSWDQKIAVVDFFFTHCPSICPKMTRSLKSVQQQYAGDTELVLNSFSVDPERDTVGQLQQYASRMDIQGNWNLLTGSKKQIYQLARKSFLIVATDGDGGPEDFIHSELLVLVDKEKRIRGYYNGTRETDVNDLIRDINRLKKEYPH